MSHQVFDPHSGVRVPKQKVGDKKLGMILIQKKFVSPQQLAQAMAAQLQLNLTSKKKFRIGEILLFQKIITLPQLHESLREQGAPKK